MRPGKRSTACPARLTLLAGGAQHVWIGLQWEAVGLQRAREAQPFDLISTIYGAINFAITVQSLEDWTAKARVTRDRSKGGGRVAHAKEIEEDHRGMGFGWARLADRGLSRSCGTGDNHGGHW